MVTEPLVSVAIGTQHDPGMQDAARTEVRAIHQRTVRADVAILADLHIAPDEGAGSDLCPGADPCIGLDDDARTDADAITELDAVGDHRTRVDARLPPVRRKQLQRLDEPDLGSADT